MQLFVNARFLTQPLTGVQRYGIEVSRQIKEDYPEVVFLSPRNVIHEKIASELSAIRIGNFSGHLWEQFSLPLWLSKKPDSILFNPGNTAPLGVSNNFVTIHDLAFFYDRAWNRPAFNTLYKFLIPKIARKAKHVFTVSATIKAELIAKLNLPPDKVSITYNGLPLQFQSEEPAAKERLILTVGSFNMRKNHDKLVAAFLGSDLVDNYKLVIVGTPGKIFRETELQLQNHPSIIIEKRLSDEQLVNYYKRAEIVASLSSYEGFGIPVLEALHFGCKVICSNIATYNELYKKYVYFCDPQNIADVSRSLSSAASGNLIRPPIDFFLNKYNYKSSAEIIMRRIASYSIDTLK